MNEFIATLDRFEEDMAVLRFADGQELVVPIDSLPDSATEGASITVTFGTSATATQDREQMARDLLTEVLQGE